MYPCVVAGTLSHLFTISFLKYVKIHSNRLSATLTPKVTPNLKSYEILYQKTNQILITIVEKIKFCLFKKTVSCSFYFRVNDEKINHAFK